MAKNTQDQSSKKNRLMLRFLRALANPVRLAIILELLDGDQCSVGYLASRQKAEVSKISKHLAILKGAGIVSTVRDRQWVYYCMKSPEITEYIRQLRGLPMSSGSK